ncbi:hypothetical protein LCGC14_1332500 [marine sediment metagenome]|uniref:Uncharacterized protein n=1 Tax=marine sediment metagenome TaxID=412755 RepID=A0A0F9MWY5_9ZZZZ|nr:MAG: hypothetical protein Lokiarch_05570 [Candidatus Lokiarchaeum sp. GC14_75]
MSLYKKIFKTQIKNRKLENASESSRYNPKYHEEAEKAALSTNILKYRSLF